LSLFLIEPNFVGSFDIGEFVYFFFRESAVEYINCGKNIYSRVARVCKVSPLHCPSISFSPFNTTSYSFHSATLVERTFSIRTGPPFSRPASTVQFRANFHSTLMKFVSNSFTPIRPVHTLSLSSSIRSDAHWSELAFLCIWFNQ